MPELAPRFERQLECSESRLFEGFFGVSLPVIRTILEEDIDVVVTISLLRVETKLTIGLRNDARTRTREVANRGKTSFK